MIKKGHYSDCRPQEKDAEVGGWQNNMNNMKNEETSRKPPAD